MVDRCYNSKCKSYPRYGGRGITVCPQWLTKNGKGFAAFWRYVGDPPAEGDYSLDRIDNDGHYEPGNVRWATRSQQAFNRSSRSRHSKADDVMPSQQKQAANSRKKDK
jgi:hypothetical protein